MKFLLLSILIGVAPRFSFAQPIETVIEDALGTSIVQTDDGGFAVAGNAFSLATGSPYLVKLSADGKIEWSNVIWNSNFSIPTTLLQTADGGYLFSGRQLIKFDKAGLIQWYRWEYRGNAIQTKDSGYLLTGSDEVMDSAGIQTAQILKIDQAGEFQWQFALSNIHGYNSVSKAVMAIELSDGYLIGGNHTRITPGESPMIFLAKISLSGQLIWERNLLLHSFNPAYLSRIIVTADGGIAIAATTVINNGFKTFNGDILCIKCTNTGIPQWATIVDALANENSIGLVETSDGSLVVAGSTTIDSVSGILLVTISGVGQLKTVRRMHLKDRTIKPNAMIPLPSDRFMLIGLFQDHTNDMFVLSSDAFCSMQDILVQVTTLKPTVDSVWIKDTIRIGNRTDVFYTTLQSAAQTDFCSLLANIKESTKLSSAVSVFPNPIVSFDPIIIYCSSVSPGYYEVSLRDALGKQVYHETRHIRGEEEITVSVADLPSGIYTVELLDANTFASVWRGKVVKTK